MVTYARSLSPDKQEFIEEMETKKITLTEALNKHLGTNVPVAFVENHNKKLQKLDDWTLLPGYKFEKLYFKRCF